MFGIKKESAYPLVGIAAALFIFPIVELLLSYKFLFPSYPLFLVVQGGIIGGIYSAFFSLTQGVLASDPLSAFLQGLKGLVIGAVGGIIVFFLGELLHSFALNYAYWMEKSVYEVFYAAARVLSWGIIGFFVGMGEGLKKNHLQSALVSGLGGLLGGILGGLFFVLLSSYLPALILRMVLFVILGISIGLCINIIKKPFASLELTFLNGDFFQKTITIIEKTLIVGKNAHCDLRLHKYSGVSREHARIQRGSAGEVKIIDLNSKNGTILNDKKVTEHKLKNGDILELGCAKMLVRIGGR